MATLDTLERDTRAYPESVSCALQEAVGERATILSVRADNIIVYGATTDGEPEVIDSCMRVSVKTPGATVQLDINGNRRGLPEDAIKTLGLEAIGKPNQIELASGHVIKLAGYYVG